MWLCDKPKVLENGCGGVRVCACACARAVQCFALASSDVRRLLHSVQSAPHACAPRSVADCSEGSYLHRGPWDLSSSTTSSIYPRTFVVPILGTFPRFLPLWTAVHSHDHIFCSNFLGMSVRQSVQIKRGRAYSTVLNNNVEKEARKDAGRREPGKNRAWKLLEGEARNGWQASSHSRADVALKHVGCVDGVLGAGG